MSPGNKLPRRRRRCRTGRKGRKRMAKLTRRSLLRNCFGLVAAGTLARPYIANAAAATAALWWTQGSAEEEDISFKKIVAEYEKASGNTIDTTASCPMRRCGKRSS